MDTNENKETPFQVTSSVNFNSLYDISLPQEQMELKMKLLKNLKSLNLKSSSYDDIIKDYQKLMDKYLNSRSKVENSEITRSLNLATEKGTIGNMNQAELTKSIVTLQTELTKTQSISQERLENLNKNLIHAMELREKLDKCEEELSKAKAKNQIFKQKIEALEKRNKELNQITQSQEKELKELKSENDKLKTENIKLNETANKLLVENKILTQKILTLQEETMDKMNEYNELIESAKQKKKAADTYFSEKSESFEKKKKKIPNFMVNVEEVQIPKKLKFKFKPHSKGITSITFNSFGSNFITTGSDNFIKLWDTSKNSESAIYSGFTGAVTEAYFAH